MMFSLRSIIPMCLILFSFASSDLKSQQTVYDGPTILYEKSIHGGIHLHPKGWGLNFFSGDIQTVDKTRLIGIEILGMKHSKELKLTPFDESAKGFSYGKLNAFYIIRPSYGVKRVLTDKLRKGGLEVSLVTAIGPSLGFTKPIYLEIDTDPRREILNLSSERYDPDNHNTNNIHGKSSGFQGFSELRIRPGVYVKTSLFFEISPYKTQMKGVEVGAAVDAYSEKIPIMAFEENNQFFFSFFINLFIGSKYNRNDSE